MRHGYFTAFRQSRESNQDFRGFLFIKKICPLCVLAVIIMLSIGCQEPGTGDPPLPEYYVTFDLNANPDKPDAYPYTLVYGTTWHATCELPYVYAYEGNYYIGAASELKTEDNMEDIDYLEIRFAPQDLNDNTSLEANIAFYKGNRKTIWWTDAGTVTIDTVTDEYITGTFDDVLLDHFQGHECITIALSGGKFKVKNYLPQ
jgi:hypothetical protein